MPGIAKMPTKERHSRFQYATSSSSSVLNSVAAVKECHSTLHLYVSNCDASSVSQRGMLTTPTESSTLAGVLNDLQMSVNPYYETCMFVPVQRL